MKNKNYFLSLIGFLFFLGGGIFYFSHSLEQGDTKNYKVCFSPRKHCQELIVKHIDGAQKDIYIQAFVLTSQPIIDALVAAFKKGKLVYIILDARNAKHYHKETLKLLDAGIPVYLDDIKNGFAHNKIMIFDQETVLTGSFNFSKKADCINAENILILKNKALAECYLQNWNKRLSFSIMPSKYYFRNLKSASSLKKKLPS